MTSDSRVCRLSNQAANGRAEQQCLFKSLVTIARPQIPRAVSGSLSRLLYKLTSQTNVTKAANEVE